MRSADKLKAGNERTFEVRIHFLTMDLEIGQRVQVRRMRDRVAKSLAARLGKTGTVKDLKVLDGNNIGALIAFEADNYTTWFFEDELKVVE